MGEKKIYLDNAASMTPFPKTLELLHHDFSSLHGNPHASHDLGESLKNHIDTATQDIAQMVSCAFNEITWTSSATESNNIAIDAACKHMTEKYGSYKLYYHPMVHASVREPCLFRKGVELKFDSSTRMLDPLALESLVAHDNHGVILCLPFGNNETGYLEDFSALSPILKSRNNVWVHADAAQALGKVTINLSDTVITSMSFSGHKIGAPIGIAALYIKMRPSKFFKSLMLGGGHQNDRRSGTLSTPLVKSFAHAATFNDMSQWAQISKYKQELDDFLVNTGYFESLNLSRSLPHILGIVIKKDHERILNNMNQFFQFSQTAACSSSLHKPSRTLECLSLTPDQQRWYCRLSFTMFFNEQELALLKEVFENKVL